MGHWKEKAVYVYRIGERVARLDSDEDEKGKQRCGYIVRVGIPFMV